MNDVSFLILKIVVSVCASLVTLYVVPYVYTLQKNERYVQVMSIVKNAVQAAEQVVKGEGMGTVKKERVMLFVRDWCAAQRIAITEKQLDELVEAAVYGMKQGAK